MPGIAPAKVQHMAVRLTRHLRVETTPVWDEEAKAWQFSIENDIECAEMLHYLLEHETGGDYSDCTQGHSIRCRLTYRRGGYRHGIRTWRVRTHVIVDEATEIQISASAIFSLLAKPTNPQGEGKAHGPSAGSNKQTMNVKRTTVIRV